jgi:hypothetical protein
MAFSDNMSAADLAAITGNNNNGWGGDASWIIILFLFMFMGWGGSGICNGAGNGAGNLYPWMNQSDQINSGFRDQMINDNVTEIRNGVNGIQTQLCNGFADIEQGANTRQMANMQQSFANQTAMMQGFNNMQSQLADCCCENRLAACQTQNIIQNEGNATRFADANNTRDIIESQNRGNQAILDKLCQLELDGVKAQVEAKNDRINELTTQLNMATLRESQIAQNAFISQGFANEVDQLYNRLSSCPVPSTPVFGRTPIFTCNQQVNPCGSGCGM